MRIVVLEYTFMFDPTDTWQHLSQFEQSLNKFFDENQFEATVLNPSGEQNKRLLFIRSKVSRVVAEATKQGRPKEMKRVFNDLRQKKESPVTRDFNKGKKIKGFERVERKAVG